MVAFYNMKRTIAIFTAIVTVALAARAVAQSTDEKPVKLVPVLKFNKDLDQRTVIRPSAIPGAGDGLFAAAAIKAGEIIGELGGRLVTADEYPLGNYYLASIPECAWEETRPYKYLDAQHFGGNVSRINFAPRRINGKETKFQNAGIRQLCDYPYVIFIALRDIEPGAEIWASYGPHYDYKHFMYAPEVRDFFCARMKLDCLEQYSFDY